MTKQELKTKIQSDMKKYNINQLRQYDTKVMEYTRLCEKHNFVFYYAPNGVIDVREN